MFINCKAQRVFVRDRSANEVELNNFDMKLLTQNGPTYQQTLYAEFDKDGVCLMKHGCDNEFSPIYAIYGYMLEEDDLKTVKLSFVKVICNEIFDKKLTQKGISIIYFSRGQFKQKCKKKSKAIQFKDFKECVLKQMQSKYLKCIKSVYVCHEGFIARSLNTLLNHPSELHSQIVDCLIKYCNSLEELVSKLGPLFECEAIREEVQQYNKSVDWLETYSDMDKKIAKRKMIDEVGEIEGVTSIYKRKISEYEMEDDTAIPMLLNSLLRTVEKSECLCVSEGIFRKACDHKKLTILENELQKCGFPQQIEKVAEKYDADTVACCIKSIFNKLSPPIINYDIYDALISKMDAMHKENEEKQKVAHQHSQAQKNQNVENNISEPNAKLQLEEYKMDQLIAYLSYYIETDNRVILSRLIAFFRSAILPNEKRNKMGAYNLSVVMAPCIFRPRKYSTSDLINSGRMATLLFNLIQSPEKLQ